MRCLVTSTTSALSDILVSDLAGTKLTTQQCELIKVSPEMMGASSGQITTTNYCSYQKSKNIADYLSISSSLSIIVC